VTETDDEAVSNEGEETALSAKTIAAVEASRAHAADLVAAANEIVERFPHLAYHFAVLALEEVGRGVLIVIRDSSAGTDEPRSVTAGMEDHEAKLFWALWSPELADPLTPRQIDDFREMARRIHEVRKSGLYFDPAAATLPRDAISREEGEHAIRLAESRLGMENNRRWVPKGAQQAEDMEWFSGVLKDSQLREFVFSGPSIKVLNELRSIPQWVRWMREQVEQGERQAEATAREELARQRPEGNEALEPKWRMRFRLFSESHSIRNRSLNIWNESNDWTTLRRANADEVIVEFTMPKAVLAGAVWPASYALAQRLLLAFNIATFGFFWWQRRDHVTRFYESLEDLETEDQVVIERAPALTIKWGEHQVLDDRAIRRVLLCFAMLPHEGDAPANEAFGHYLRGLALLAKSDVHLQFDANIFEELLLALREGMRTYGGWDGEEPFATVFASFVERFEKDDDERALYFAAVEGAEDGDLARVKLSFDQVVMMKGLADAFFFETLDRLAAERMSAENGD
jgi:AbiV family abortive infection protein